jgi:uncharacterized protein YdcH (DUF465 family)
MVVPIRESLLESSEDFRRLCQEHEKYSKQVEALHNKPYLSDEDKIEEVRLKKLKLHLKDQMEAMAAEYEHGHPVATA